MRSASLLVVLAATAVTADEWSFKAFLAGDWSLERQIPGQKADFAHYSLKAVGANLEGSYYEDGEEGKINEMVVRVVFDDARSGQFQLAKLRPPPSAADESADEPPTPQPQPEPRTAFEFEFRPQNDGRFQLSESKWLGKQGGTVQFLAPDDDSFIFSKVSMTCADGTAASCGAQMTAWTASRQGESRRKGPAEGPRTLWQKYGWYVFFAILYFGYKAAAEKAAKVAGGMSMKKK